jgi:hypothetical protein
VTHAHSALSTWASLNTALWLSSFLLLREVELSTKFDFECCLIGHLMAAGLRHRGLTVVCNWSGSLIEFRAVLKVFA